MMMKYILIAVIVGIIAVPYLFGKIVEHRIINELHERYGEDYAILAANVDGNPGLTMNMYKKIPQMLLRIISPPQPTYIGGYPFYGIFNHLIYSVSDNQRVENAAWSFKKFNLVFEDGHRIDALYDNVQEPYRYEPAQLKIIRGLRVKQIEKPKGVSWYMRNYGGIQSKSDKPIRYQLSASPFFSPDIIRDTEHLVILPLGVLESDLTYEVMTNSVGYPTVQHETENVAFAYQYIGTTDAGVHVLLVRYKYYADDSANLLFVTLQKELTMKYGRTTAGYSFEPDTYSTLRRWGWYNLGRHPYQNELIVRGNQVLSRSRDTNEEQVLVSLDDQKFLDLLATMELIDCEGRAIRK